MVENAKNSMFLLHRIQTVLLVISVPVVYWSLNEHCLSMTK